VKFEAAHLQSGQYVDVGGGWVHHLEASLRDSLGLLKDKEQRVLRLRYGLGNDQTHTLEEIGKTFDLTRERIRQIEAGALRKIRHSAFGTELRGFLEE